MGKRATKTKSAYFLVNFEGGTFTDRWTLLDRLEWTAEHSVLGDEDGVKVIKVEKYVER